MSTKKYTNVHVLEIHARLMSLLGLGSKTALAKELGVSLQNLRNREERGVNKLDDIELLCNRKGIDRDQIFSGDKGVASGGVKITQDATTNGGDIHIDIHHPPAAMAHDRHEQYADPIAQLFIKDWLQLSDVVKMRVWTLVKEELEKMGSKAE